MKRETLIWTVLFIAGGLFFLVRGLTAEHGFGKAYVKKVTMKPASDGDARAKYVDVDPTADASEISIPRTVGLWVAAFFTLAIFSFLHCDNVFYKLAESIFVGVTAAFVMVQAFWDVLVKKLLTNLAPQFTREWALPDIKDDQHSNLLYLIPLLLGIMLLWRLAPRGGWIARWPLAFIVGTFAGVKLISFLQADFVSQIRSTIVPLVVVTAAGSIDVWASLRNIGLIFGVFSCLTYFFFSVAHRGLVGKVSRVGVWFLMITFGASFAFTVMGRIALFAARLEFLFDDWLWLIDPKGKRLW